MYSQFSVSEILVSDYKVHTFSIILCIDLIFKEKTTAFGLTIKFSGCENMRMKILLIFLRGSCDRIKDCSVTLQLAASQSVSLGVDCNGPKL
jgi:hypothetical protein